MNNNVLWEYNIDKMQNLDVKVRKGGIPLNKNSNTMIIKKIKLYLLYRERSVIEDNLLFLYVDVEENTDIA